MMLLPQGLKALKRVAKEVGVDLRGASLNLDGGFDSTWGKKKKAQEFRLSLERLDQVVKDMIVPLEF
jgi:hypothetical protein